MLREWKWITVVALVIAVVAIGGCKPKAASTTADTGAATTDKGAAVTGSGDSEETPAVALPAGFPADVPIYENAKIESVFENDVTGGKNYMVAMTSDDDAAAVHAAYKKALEDKGWTITSAMEVGDSVGGINAEKGSLKVNLAIGYGAEKKAQITLTVQPKQ